MPKTVELFSWNLLCSSAEQGAEPTTYESQSVRMPPRHPGYTTHAQVILWSDIGILSWWHQPLTVAADLSNQLPTANKSSHVHNTSVEDSFIAASPQQGWQVSAISGLSHSLDCPW